MPKNSEMFSTKTSNSAVLETVDIVGGTHLADNLNPEIFKELEQNTHYVDTTAEVAAECKSVCDDDHIDTTNLNSLSYLPDLGLWSTFVSENMREYWIAIKEVVNASLQQESWISFINVFLKIVYE